MTHLLQKVSIVFMFLSFPHTHMCVCSFAPTNASSLGGPQTKKRTLSRKLREARLWLVTHMHVVVCELRAASISAEVLRERDAPILYVRSHAFDPIVTVFVIQYDIPRSSSGRAISVRRDFPSALYGVPSHCSHTTSTHELL